MTDLIERLEALRARWLDEARDESLMGIAQVVLTSCAQDLAEVIEDVKE